MSIPDVGLGHSFAHRVIAQVAVSSLGLRFVRDLGARIDPTLMRLTGGRVSCVWPFPAVLVSHVGARTGIGRTNAVVYFTDQGRVVLIPSNFGSARNPAWYHNVKANPIVELYGRGIRGQFVAEEVYGEERDRLFARVKGAPGPYAKYEEVAGAKARSIPVMTFIPRSSSRAAIAEGQ